MHYKCGRVSIQSDPRPGRQVKNLLWKRSKNVDLVGQKRRSNVFTVALDAVCRKPSVFGSPP
jgi:hypothetical protein